MFVNDDPIKSRGDDLLDRATFSDRLGKSLLEWKDDSSIIIGIYGSWGSGKSSIINLAIEWVENNTKSARGKEKPIVIHFNPWNFTEQNQLLTAYFSELSKSFDAFSRFTKLTDKKALAKNISKKLITYGKFFLPILPYTPIAPAIMPFIPKIEQAVKHLDEHTKGWDEIKTASLEKIKNDLSKAIKELDKKIIIVIDDIDRLTPTETRQIFQLVKLNANFPNTMYILSFAHEKVAEMLTEGNFSGEEYLEKIVQVPFHVPPIERRKLNQMFFDVVNKAIKNFDQRYWDDVRFGNLFFGGLIGYFDSVRQIKRFSNSLLFNINQIPKEINPMDFIALEAVRVFSPRVYEEIWKNKELFTERESSYSGWNEREREHRRKKFEAIFSKDTKYRGVVEKVVTQLFPQISQGGGDPDGWNTERRICAEDRFDKYFMLSVPQSEVSQDEIDKLIKKSTNVDATEKTLTKWIEANTIEDFLEKCSLYIDEVPLQKIEPFVLALMNVSDQLPRDRSGMKFRDVGDWCRVAVYNILKRVKPIERLPMLLRLVKDSKSLSTPADLILLHLNIFEKKDKEETVESLIEEKDLPKLKEAMLDKIRDFSKNGKLLNVPGRGRIFWIWRKLSEDEPKKYADEQLMTTHGIASYIEGFMWQGSSIGMGDYVAKTKWKVNAESMKEFVDLEALKQKVLKIKAKDKKSLTENQVLGLELFLDSFEKKGLLDF